MATNPTLLTQPIAANGTKNVIPNTTTTPGRMSQDQGFPAETSLPLGAGGVAPSREDFNGAFNLLSAQNFMIQKGWQFTFDAGQSYYAGCIVRDTTDGALYECINDVAAGGSVPSADSTNWKEFSTGGGVPVGFIMPYAGTGLPEGWLECDGSAVSRAMYPDLFSAIGTTWGAGDGSTTFNLPRSEDLVMQGASATNPVGTYLQAGLPNIEGSCTPNSTGGMINDSSYIGETSGAFVMGENSFSYQVKDVAGHASSLGFDASQSNPIYGASDTVQPPAACVRFMIKAFDGPTPSSAGIDLTQYAADLANKADRSLSNLTQTGEDHFLEQDFTIIYPNGGTEANPANVVKNSRYIESNPFPGYYVNTKTELFYNNVWASTEWAMDSTNGTGASAFPYDNDSSIVLVTGRAGLLEGLSNDYGNPFQIGGTTIDNLPCRVKVWKIGKVANNA